jgi:FixJ family two-component response regulator
VSISTGNAAIGPVAISVAEPSLALCLEIAIRAYGMETVIHDVADGLSNVSLDTCSTVVVDSRVLQNDPEQFLARLRRPRWRGRLIVLTEDTPCPMLMRLCGDNAVLLEKPFGSAQLIAEIDRA